MRNLNTIRTRFNGQLLRRTAMVSLCALALGACRSSGDLGIDTRDGKSRDKEIAEITLPPNPKGEVVGNGKVRVAFLLPKSAPGFKAVSTELQNGAKLAMSDFGNNTLQLVFKDTAGQPAQAQAAAAEAVQEKASAVIGPLLSGSVSAASGVTLPANLTILGFSTNTAVARRSVYLLGYTPQADTKRMITYAISRGSKSILAYLPRGAEGTLREGVLREVAGASGVDVRVVKYNRETTSIRQAIGDSSANFAGYDSLYIPDGGEIPGIILGLLKQTKLNFSDKQILGSGQWESVKTSDPNLNGAVYSSRDITNFNQFAESYAAKFGKRPGVLGALGYDAVTLASELVRQRGPKTGFAPATLENRRGFAGVNGVFRLKSDGTAERGLAIYKIEGGRGRIESPAPKSFSGS